MNNDGFGSYGSPFEYTVEKKGKRMNVRKILLILCYIAWIIAVFAVGIRIRLILPLLCFVPLSLWIIIFFTWRFTKEEMKITLFGGTMTVTRMYDGKNPKKIAEIKIKDIERLRLYSSAYLASQKPSNIIYATGNESCEGAYLLIWKDTAAVMDINEKAMKIIKYYNSEI